MESHCLYKTIFILLLTFIYGCSGQYYSVEDYRSVEKVDIHVHINKANSALAAQAVEDNFRLISVNVDLFFPNVSVEEQRIAAKGMKDLYPEQVEWLSTFEMESWDQESWEQETIAHLEKTFSEGAIGIKLWKNIGMEFRDKNGEFILIDHPRFKPVIDFVESRGKSVLAHIGEPREAWLPLEKMKLHRGYFSNNPQYHMYLHPEFPSYEEIIASRNNLLDMYPDLRIVGAHLGSMEWSIDMMSEHLEKYPNLALEMAARMRHMYLASAEDYEKARDFFITYQDQLIYSTDISESPDSDPQQVRDRASEVWQKDWEFFVSDNEMTDPAIENPLQGLKLPKTVIDKLYTTNAEKWFPEL
ncbi:hypothetical protein BH23BAC3_BH23BAC3_02830 [soil metagenome]